MKRKKVELRFDKPFIAAYSHYLFVTYGQNMIDYHRDIAHDTYWYIYTGDLRIPWGIGAQKFKAYGFLHVKRKPYGWQTFDGKELSFVKQDEVYYLYREEWNGSKFVGFLPFLSQNYVNPYISELVTDDIDADAFREALAKTQNAIPCKILEMLREHSLIFKEFTIQSIKK